MDQLGQRDCGYDDGDYVDASVDSDRQADSGAELQQQRLDQQQLPRQHYWDLWYRCGRVFSAQHGHADHHPDGQLSHQVLGWDGMGSDHFYGDRYRYDGL